MAKPQPVIEDFAQRAVRIHDENKAKLDAASAMLAALEIARYALTSWPKVTATEDALRHVDDAIAAAKAAGIKVEG